jgi:ElaB/YqjD/DUF883 family membrane-anchored ribosome-binding protein
MAEPIADERSPLKSVNKSKRRKNVNTQVKEIGNDLGTLAEAGPALIVTSAHVAGEKVAEARNCLAAALERGTELYGRVRERAVERVRATNGAMHEHPYYVLGSAFGLGAVVAYLIARRWSHHVG